MTGKIIKKENSLWVRTQTTVEGDDIVFVDYRIAMGESGDTNLKEGETVEFKIQSVDYTDVEGLGEQGAVSWAVIESKINRLEVINHNSDKFPIGRVLTFYGDVEMQLQDNGKTLKVFI